MWHHLAWQVPYTCSDFCRVRVCQTVEILGTVLTDKIGGHAEEITEMNRIRYFRERARLTQAEVATLLATDETSVSRWEHGSRALTPQIIEKLSRLFKCESWELLTDRKGLRRLATASKADAMLCETDVAGVGKP
jgi:DNA-binding XRE family transcriptional regulator